MSELNCCLSELCKEEHNHPNAGKYTKLYTVGKLFGGQAVCLWCLLHLQDFVGLGSEVKTIADNTTDKRDKFPNYYKIVQIEGEDKLRSELSKKWFEVHPDPAPPQKKKGEYKVQVS